jgi:hypothetical protein
MALSSYPGRNPFYNQDSDYWRGQEFPLGMNMPETNWRVGELQPLGAWTARLGELGFGGLDPRGQWGRSIYNRAQEGYAAAQRRNPILNWQDYLTTLDIPGMYAGLGPEEKGYQDQQFGGPARWQRRP